MSPDPGGEGGERGMTRVRCNRPSKEKEFEIGGITRVPPKGIVRVEAWKFFE